MSNKELKSSKLIQIDGHASTSYDFSAVIKHLIDVKKLRQGYIGERIGLTQGRISQIYNGADSSNVTHKPRLRLSILCVREGVNPYEINDSDKE